MLEGENPCDGMSLGYCHFPQSQVVARHPFDKQLCQRTCKLDDLCMFWRHNEALAGTIEECLFLTSNYHQSMIDCDAFASPVDGDIENCRAVNATSCYSILDEDCEYSGQRLTNLEPSPGMVGTLEDCLQFGLTLQDFGVNHVVFLMKTRECQLFLSMDQECSAVGGPQDVPHKCTED